MRHPNGSRMLQQTTSNRRLPNPTQNIMSMRRSRDNERMGKSSHTTHDVGSEQSERPMMGHASSHVTGSQEYNPTRGSTEASSGLAEGNWIAVGVDVNGEVIY